MNLIIDVGNSSVKLAVFNKSELKLKQVCSVEDLIEQVQGVKEKYDTIHSAIISSVAELKEEDIAFLNHHFNLLVLTSTTKLPFYNLYKTPNTLGVDRLALASAAVKKYPNTNVLIIDSGTCITYDFVNRSGAYLGGAISLGIRMRYNALNHFTAKLPLLETEIPESITGTSTHTSMHSGVIYGVLNEIEGVILEYKNEYSDLIVVLTGGDAIFLSKQLKSSIFVDSNFLLEGLNYILQFNSNS